MIEFVNRINTLDRLIVLIILVFVIIKSKKIWLNFFIELKEFAILLFNVFINPFSTLHIICGRKKRLGNADSSLIYAKSKIVKNYPFDSIVGIIIRK